MAKYAAPAKNDVYSLMLVVSAIIFLIGFIMNVSKLNGDYKKVQEAAKPSSIAIPEVVVAAPEAGEADNALDLDNF